MGEEREGRPRPALAVPAVVIPAGLALVQVGYFFIINRTQLGLGFPIDDAYIFKRYAENLAGGQGFSFNPGEVSFGCTSLLWPLLMAGLVKTLYFINYVTLGFWVGGNLFALSALLAAGAVVRSTGRSALGFLAGMIVAGSVPLLMNSISGMETPLTLALLMAFAGAVLADKPRPVLAGVLAGLLGLTRPEGWYFPLGALLAWLMLLPFKDKRVAGLTLLKFLVPWAWLTVPAYIFVYVHTGSILPTTYLGKIMSANPATLDQGLSQRLVLALLSLGAGWLELARPLRALAVALALGAAIEVLATLVRLFRAGQPGWPLLGRLTLAGYLLLPLAYGLFFPVGPAFGGYYVRYIAPVLAVAAVLAMIGLHTLADLGTRGPGERRWWLLAPAALVRLAGALGLIAYLYWLWSFQFKDAEQVFRTEVSLNTGLRMEAAGWIASPKNVPAGARVMVGYTGLGVVGGSCKHYVLDLGALINPDIFDYYRGTSMDPRARWAQQVKYMRDHNISYYVTFARPAEYADKIADPGSTPGFEEVTRLGTIAPVPASPYEQVRIYRIDWDRWQEAQPKTNPRPEGPEKSK